jgi:hypothetical protein
LPEQQPHYWTQPVLGKADDSSLEKYLKNIQSWDYQQTFAPIQAQIEQK